MIPHQDDSSSQSLTPEGGEGVVHSPWPKRLAVLAGPAVSMAFGAWLIRFDLGGEQIDLMSEEMMFWTIPYWLCMAGLFVTWCYFDANERLFAISTPITLVIILMPLLGFILYIYKTRQWGGVRNLIYLFLIMLVSEFAMQIGFGFAYALTEVP